jgi:hypothetical protein
MRPPRPTEGPPRTPPLTFGAAHKAPRVFVDTGDPSSARSRRPLPTNPTSSRASCARWRAEAHRRIRGSSKTSLDRFIRADPRPTDHSSAKRCLCDPRPTTRTTPDGSRGAPDPAGLVIAIAERAASALVSDCNGLIGTTDTDGPRAAMFRRTMPWLVLVQTGQRRRGADRTARDRPTQPSATVAFATVIAPRLLVVSREGGRRRSRADHDSSLAARRKRVPRSARWKCART